MIKIKTFIFISPYYSSEKIDKTINDFIEEEKVRLIELKLASASGKGTMEIIYTIIYETQQ